MKRCFAFLTTVCLAGCGTGPGDSDRVFYFFDMSAALRDSTAERIRIYNCAVSGSFELSNPLPSSGMASFNVLINRSLTEHRGSHAEFTSADTSISDAVLEYTGLGEDTLQFTFGAGSYVVTPSPGGHPAGNPTEYSAEWPCGPDFPLAQDSTLNAYGYDSDLVIPGLWRIQEILPFE
jgi:hypothetical protein